MPQGSIFGHLLYIIFTSDLFLFIQTIHFATVQMTMLCILHEKNTNIMTSRLRHDLVL